MLPGPMVMVGPRPLGSTPGLCGALRPSLSPNSQGLTHTHTMLLATGRGGVWHGGSTLCRLWSLLSAWRPQAVGGAGLFRLLSPLFLGISSQAQSYNLGKGGLEDLCWLCCCVGAHCIQGSSQALAASCGYRDILPGCSWVLLVGAVGPCPAMVCVIWGGGVHKQCLWWAPCLGMGWGPQWGLEPTRGPPLGRLGQLSGFWTLLHVIVIWRTC